MSANPNPFALIDWREDSKCWKTGIKSYFKNKTLKSEWHFLEIHLEGLFKISSPLYWPEGRNRTLKSHKPR